MHCNASLSVDVVTKIHMACAFYHNVQSTYKKLECNTPSVHSLIDIVISIGNRYVRNIQLGGTLVGMHTLNDSTQHKHLSYAIG